MTFRTKVLGFGLALLLAFVPASAQSSEDAAAIEAAAMDYILGFYQGDPDRLERALSPELKKLGWGRRAAEGPYQGPWYMTKESAKEFAPGYAESEQLPADTYRKVEILDQLDKIASVRIEAVWGIDYMHMAKIDGDWKIYNVIWQTWPDGKERK